MVVLQENGNASESLMFPYLSNNKHIPKLPHIY